MEVRAPSRRIKGYEWHVEVYYGPLHGWEHETTEESWKDARQMLKDYRANCNYPCRTRKRVVWETTP